VLFVDPNPPSTSSSTSSNDVNTDTKTDCFDKGKVDVENKPPSINGGGGGAGSGSAGGSSASSGTTSQLTTEKLNQFNLRRDTSQENASPLSIAIGGATSAHIGPVSSSSTKLRK
jgi:hypothetical protein